MGVVQRMHPSRGTRPFWTWIEGHWPLYTAITTESMASASIPRFLSPPGQVLIALDRRCFQRKPAAQSHLLQCRHASATTASPKPRLLGKPTRYYPPSHSQRLAKHAVPKQYPGPPLSDAQREEQKTKQYPNMMPAEGTFMFWFLHSRLLHMGITLVSMSTFAPKDCRYLF